MLRLLQDLLFWLIAFCLVAALWLYFTGGIMRLAVYLWMFVGVALFRGALSRPLHRLRARPKLPPAARRVSSPPIAKTVAEPDSGATLNRARLWQGQVKSVPAAAMLQVGLCFWRSAAWLARQAQQGGVWLVAHRPKQKIFPEQTAEQNAEKGRQPPRQRPQKRNKKQHKIQKYKKI